ncbi:MAG: sulfite exporter TauE/SafE family protein [Actinomycetota bacterium]|nr:sulfite exporter TauE/SafE family protein [Actinomycetota bacterium]
MSLWAVLLTGLFAGGGSCAAVQGGLLAGVVARRRQPAPLRVGAARGRGAKRAKPAPPPAPTPIEDALPVGMFLAGKLVSHVVLGASLGLLGNAVQLGPRTRAYMQIAAGLVMVALALDLLGVSAVRRVLPAPPAGWSRLVRHSGRWGNGLAPGLLGLATVLIPCGVTLSMMFLAVASGSPLSGAAIMAVFVLGTAPLFAVIGYAARRSTDWLRGRLSVLAGAAVLVAGLVAVNAGLVLNGSSFTLAGALRSVTGSRSAAPVAASPVGADGVQRILIDVHDTGYSPSSVTARAGVPTELTMRTDGTQGCTRALVMSSFGVQKVLPATGDTRIELGELEPGTYRYTCGMGMYGGSIRVVA